ncbi:MAG: HD domain-containing protein [ANME-2 cluster archaeon]|nr:MAG: HD domain-containing protein [ANME-2 cluster archaeon]
MKIRDAVYGDIELLPFEVKLLDTFEMQRLRKVRELAFVHLVYPTAIHTRFDHSIGVRHCVQQILERSHIELPKEEKELLFKAALLHDIGHPCFSHITEELEGIPKHTEFVRLMLQGEYKDVVIDNKILTRDEANRIDFVADVINGNEVSEILGLIDNKQSEDFEKNYLSDFIDGYIDADSLDYVRRDGYFLGLPYGNFDDRIFSSFHLVQTVTDKKLTFSDKKDSLSSIMTFLRARFELFRAAYRHHTVVIADSMLHYALEAWARDNSDLLFILGDDELLSRMYRSEKAREMIIRLQSRQLYKRAYTINRNSSPGAVTKAEGIMNNLNDLIEFNQKINSENDMKTENFLLNHERRKVWKDYGKVLIGIEKPYELKEVARHELETLQEMYETIWNFSVYTSQPILANKIYEICARIFKDKGEFHPKSIIAPIYYDAISQVIAEIVKEKKSSLKILNQLDSESRINSDTIGDNLGLSRSTASHYLTYIDKKFKERGINLIKSKRINYKKFWWIEDSEVFERVKSEIKDYVF